MLTPVSKPECQPREHEQRYARHCQGTAVVGEQLGLPICDVGGVHHAFVEAHGHDDQVQQQVGSHHEHRDADSLPEALEEDRAERRQQHESDDYLLAVEGFRRQGVLHDVRRSVGRRERDRDHPAGRHEPEQAQNEQLAFPEGEKVFEHRDRALAGVGSLCHLSINR
jgi:hypothetical protein